MTLRIKLATAAVSTRAGIGAVSLAGGQGTATATAKSTAVAAQLGDTATVRLHISGMTCGTCPATARTALKKQPRVFDAKVTLDDSLGVVRHDRSTVTAPDIAAHLTKLTGYGVRIIEAPAKIGR